jgi:sugar-phosphatase
MAAEIEARGLLFDMDGVLLSSIGSVLRSWRAWAAHYGVANADSLDIPHGMRAIEIVARLAPHADVNEAMQRIEDIEVADTADTLALPGAAALLQSLPAGQWTIVTSATRKLAEVRLHAAGLRAPERMICADDVTRGKPDPEPYRRGAELLGFAAAECIVVEDAAGGVRAGKAAGCRSLGVAGTQTAEELRAAGAEWVVDSLEQVRVRAEGATLNISLA